MNLVSKKWLVAWLSKLVLIVIFAKALSLGVLWFLPGEGVDFREQQSWQVPYARYKLGEIPVKAEAQSKSAAPQVSSLVLKGIYHRNKGGYIVVALANKPNESEVIGIGESFNGYTLRSIAPTSAVMEMKGKEYTLSLPLDEGPTFKRIKPSAPATPGGSVGVMRKDVENYAKNFDQIWKDIGIAEVKNNGRIEGFQVTRIRSGSPMAALGLQKGDVIIRANNKRLDSYAAAMQIYQNIGKIDALELVVLRNNQEKELLYELR